MVSRLLKLVAPAGSPGEGRGEFYLQVKAGAPAGSPVVAAKKGAAAKPKGVAAKKAGAKKGARKGAGKPAGKPVRRDGLKAPFNLSRCGTFSISV